MEAYMEIYFVNVQIKNEDNFLTITDRLKDHKFIELSNGNRRNISFIGLAEENIMLGLSIDLDNIDPDDKLTIINMKTRQLIPTKFDYDKSYSESISPFLWHSNWANMFIYR